MGKNESVRFHDSKLKLVKALLFRSFHETEAPTAGCVQRLFVEGRIECKYLSEALETFYHHYFYKR